MDEQRGIGKDGKIPWQIPEDMARFKQLTTGHPVIMGRVTWDSIPRKFRPLPERPNFVVTRDSSLSVPGVSVAHSIDEAILFASQVDREKIYVMGGAQIYAHTLPLADKLQLTVVAGDYGGDTFFPDPSNFGRITQVEPGESDWLISIKGPKYRFVTIERN